MNHQRGEGHHHPMTQMQEEIVLIVGFGLLWIGKFIYPGKLEPSSMNRFNSGQPGMESDHWSGIRKFWVGSDRSSVQKWWRREIILLLGQWYTLYHWRIFVLLTTCIPCNWMRTRPIVLHFVSRRKWPQGTSHFLIRISYSCSLTTSLLFPRALSTLSIW